MGGFCWPYDDVVKVPDSYFWGGRFKPGPSIDRVEGFELWKKGVVNRSHVPVAEINEVARSMFYPMKVALVLKQWFSGCQLSLTLLWKNRRSPLRTCPSGNEPGTWTSVSSTFLESGVGVGHEFRHNICPVMDHWDFDFKSRL